MVKIAAHRSFHEQEEGIFGVGEKDTEEYQARLIAARKAVQHGFTVYMLPNPKTTRSADFIFVKKGYYSLYDLKTISGKASAGSRLQESIGQTNRVLLHIVSDYNVEQLARDIRKYFEANSEAVEVVLIRRNKMLSINRMYIGQKDYFKNFRRQYVK